MRRAGRVVAEMHERHARPRSGRASPPPTSTASAARSSSERGATSNFLGYHGYPAVICASPNEVVVHGIPGDRVLDEGDIVSIDCGAIVDGWHGDAAYTAGVGEISPRPQRLIEVAERSLDAAIEQMVAGRTLGDLGHAVQRVIEGAGLWVVDGYSGHAIGRAMHEAPSVPNVGWPGRGPTLRVGNVLAIEPMVARRAPPTPTCSTTTGPSSPLDGSLGRPRRAHRRRHRRRPRGPHPPLTGDRATEPRARRATTSAPSGWTADGAGPPRSRCGPGRCPRVARRGERDVRRGDQAVRRGDRGRRARPGRRRRRVHGAARARRAAARAPPCG